MNKCSHTFKRSVEELLTALKKNGSESVNSGDLLFRREVTIRDAIYKSVDEGHVMAQVREQNISIALRGTEINQAVEESSSVFVRRFGA